MNGITWLVCQWCGAVYKIKHGEQLPHRCTNPKCMCTLSDLETYIPEDDGLLEKFRSKDWTVEEVKREFAKNIEWAHVVFEDELQHLDEYDWPIEELPKTEWAEIRRQRRYENMNRADGWHTTKDGGEVKRCDICGRWTCFEGPVTYRGKEAHEGDRCDLCEKWVCQDCQDWAKECRDIDGEYVENVCKRCGSQLNKEGGHKIE